MRVNGIIWLASYPKSGNTWLRIFIENLFRNSQGPAPINAMNVVKYGDAQIELYEGMGHKKIGEFDDDELHALRKPIQHWLAHRPETAMVKTHNALTTFKGTPLIYLEYTVGAVYLIRNPFDVAVSLAHHFQLTTDEAVESLCSPYQRTHTSPNAVFQILGSWTDHYRTWFDVQNFNPLLLRYEDMVADPMKSFGRFMKFLKVPQNPDRLKRAIRNSLFREVEKQEREAGFKERAHAGQKFFRSGKFGAWRDVLNEDHVKKLVDAHHELLLQQRYIDKNGNPRV